MLIEQIRRDFIEARKARNAEKSAFLSTLLSEVERIGKDNGNRQTTDEEAVKVVKKFVKNAEETIAVGEKSGKDVSASKREVEILNGYLPQQLTAEQLTVIISAIVETLPEKSPKATGKIMSELKANYNGQYDGKMASDLVKQLLA